MDKSAIEQIQVSAHIPEILEQVTDAKTQTPVVTLPQGMRVESLEDYMPLASRYRLSFQTTSANDFIKYNNLRDREGAMCFVDVESMRARTVFDLGTIEKPEHKEHSASLRLYKTSPYQALIDLTQHPRSQKDAGEFIEDWDDFITASNESGGGLTNKEAARGLRSLTIETAKEIHNQVGDLSSEQSAMERIEAKNKMSIPNELCFQCQPYSGFVHREFRVRISILTGDRVPKISFRIIGLDALKEDIAEEFKDGIIEETKDLKLKTFIGEV